MATKNAVSVLVSVGKSQFSQQINHIVISVTRNSDTVIFYVKGGYSFSSS